MSSRLIAYASPTSTRRALVAARTAGLDIAKVRLLTDGTIEIIAAAAAAVTATDDFARLERAGLL